MSSYVKKTQGENLGGDVLQFPDRAAFVSVEEYDKTVKAYWKAIGKYRDLAAEFHRDIMKGKNPGSDRSKKEQDSK